MKTSQGFEWELNKSDYNEIERRIPVTTSLFMVTVTYSNIIVPYELTLAGSETVDIGGKELHKKFQPSFLYTLEVIHLIQVSH
ncbi:hypothetical protein L1887_39271 [Cichorium endivia]|nr:hypothetical protein L1887_39271 [Cichorium endivia]